MGGVSGRGRRSLALWRARVGAACFEARERRKCAVQTIFFSEIDLMPGACVLDI